MFKKWQPKKAAIRVSKTYNSVQMPEAYIIKTEKQIKDIIEHVKANEDVYCRNMAREDNLSGPTTMHITENESEVVPNEINIPILATTHYYYSTPHGLKKTKTSILPFILLFLTVIVVFNILFFVEGAKQTRLKNMCKVYYLHGEPTHIMLGDKEFDINNITREDMIFMNPWEQEVLRNTKVSDCLRIDRR